MSVIETIRSFVNTWECDSHGHLNARFYAARFENAARCFARLAGFETEQKAPPRNLLIKFHSEARSGQLLVVDSAFLRDAPWKHAIGHRMFDASSGLLLASALDSTDALKSLPVSLTQRFQRDYEPHRDGSKAASIVFEHVGDKDEIKARGGITTARGVILPADVDVDGNALEQTHVGFFSDGAAHMWQDIGLTKQSSASGRAVVNLSMSFLAPLRAGDLVEQLSHVTRVRSRTITMRHYQFNAVTGAVSAIAEAVGMIMNLETRKSVAIPEHIRHGHKTT